MRQIYYIMKAELQSLFYSPIAWLVLIVFTLQCSVNFYNILEEVVRETAKGSSMPTLTGWFFSRDFNGLGVFNAGMRYLYIYFPLLTMGIFSKELASGSIKLLDSSPVSCFQIVMGKFMAMVAYSLVLIAVSMIFVFYAAAGIENFDWSYIFVIVVGMFLTMLMYSAIGIFASSLTRYQVVAAIASFVVFVVLERIGNYGQNYDGIREITTWLSTSGRVQTFMDGLLTSQNLVYFLGITVLFVAFTVLRLWLARFHYPLWRKAAYYAGVLVLVVCCGWISNRPALRYFWDATGNDRNTIPAETQEVMKKLRDQGPLTVTTYVNLMDRYRGQALPSNISSYEKGYDQYLRFKPDIHFKYVYYYAPTDLGTGVSKMKKGLTFEEEAAEIARLMRTDFSRFMPQEEADKLLDLSAEHYRFLRVFEMAGRESRVRIYDEIPPHPDMREFSAAFQRLTGEKAPLIGVVTGHGERSIRDTTDRGYEKLSTNVFNRNSWENLGIDEVEITLAKPVPDGVDILMIADPQTAYTEEELAHFDDFLARGGNLILLAEPENEAVRPLLGRFGLELMEGCLAQKPLIELANVVATGFLPQSKDCWGELRNFRPAPVALVGAAGLRLQRSTDYKAFPLMATAPEAWVKYGKVDWIMGPVEPDPAKGEKVGSNITAFGFTRTVGDREQRIFVCGDADWLSNRGLFENLQGFSGHYPKIVNSMLCAWMTYGEAPFMLTYKQGTDVHITTTMTGVLWAKILLIWGLAAVLIATGTVVCVRRNRH